MSITQYKSCWNAEIKLFADVSVPKGETGSENAESVTRTMILFTPLFGGKPAGLLRSKADRLFLKMDRVNFCLAFMR